MCFAVCYQDELKFLYQMEVRQGENQQQPSKSICNIWAGLCSFSSVLLVFPTEGLTACLRVDRAKAQEKGGSVSEPTCCLLF